MSLLTDIQQIKNETVAGANTALRIGGVLEDIYSINPKKITLFSFTFLEEEITNLNFVKNDHNILLADFETFDDANNFAIVKTNGWNISKVFAHGNCTDDEGTDSGSVSFNINASNNDRIQLTRTFPQPSNCIIKIEEY